MVKMEVSHILPDTSMVRASSMLSTLVFQVLRSCLSEILGGVVLQYIFFHLYSTIVAAVEVGFVLSCYRLDNMCVRPVVVTRA